MREYFQRNSTGTRNLLNRLTRRCCQNKVISKLEKKGRDDFCNLDDSNLEATPNISFRRVTLHFRPPFAFSRCFDETPFLRWPQLDPRKKLSLLVSRYDRSLPRTKSHFPLPSTKAMLSHNFPAYRLERHQLSTINSPTS